LAAKSFIKKVFEKLPLKSKKAYFFAPRLDWLVHLQLRTLELSPLQ
jgi:hypothetical protein